MSVLAILAAAASVASATAAEPMLDGRCDDHRGAGREVAVGEGVTAFVHQTPDHVWFCFEVPDGSYATLDLKLNAPALAGPLNLHASAQLGGWPADEPEAAPKDAKSAGWWKGTEGWWATTTPFNGAFMTVRGREMQLAKAHFGRGKWTYAVTLSDVASNSGSEFRAVRWPETGTLALDAD